MDVFIQKSEIQLDPPKDIDALKDDIKSINAKIGDKHPAKGERSIVCWNCLSVLMIKEEWGIVQCTNCEKFNRIPGESEEDKKKSILSLDDNKNHFEICAPYVYVIMTCPYCQSENKVRKEAEHVVCFKCHNSFAIQNPSIKVISSKEPISLTGKTKRFSDVYDIPHLRNYQNYPFPYQCFNVNQCHNCNEKTEAVSQMIDRMHRPPPVKYQPPVDRLGPLKQLIKDMDEIDQKRTKLYDRGYRKGEDMKKYEAMLKEPNPITQDKSDNFLKRNLNLFPSYSMKPLGNAAYNALFSPYQKKY